MPLLVYFYWKFPILSLTKKRTFSCRF